MIKAVDNKKTIAELTPLGDSAVVVTFGSEMSISTHKQIMALMNMLEDTPFEGFVESVPAFTNLTIFYDPLIVYQTYQGKDSSLISPFKIVSALVEKKLASLTHHKNQPSHTVEIPVCYGGEYGPDLQDVAKINGLTPDEVISIHSSGEYLVYMVGFAPGFPFLGGMSEKIKAPRRSSPRASIPKGSVGIAGMQTGVYPISTPGGWQLIGQTPKPLFLPEQNPPSLLEAGNIVKFIPITQHEFLKFTKER